MLTIKELSDKTGVTAHTLRYYEREGILPAIKRDDNGKPLYDDESIEGLDFILALRSTGMPLAKIKHYVSLYLEGDSTTTKRKELLLEHKKKVNAEIKQSLENMELINYKLGLYEMQEKANIKKMF